MEVVPCQRRSVHTCGGSLLLVAFATTLLAASGPQQGPSAKFSASTDLVQVDVRVADKAGRFVEGLRADDFEVREDGVLRPVRALASLVGGMSPVDRTRSSWKPARSLWIFFFDHRNLQPDGLTRAYAAVERFVIGRSAADALMGIVYQDKVLGNKLTGNSDDVLMALSKVQLASEPADAGDSWASRLLEERGSANSLGTLAVLADRLSQYPGPKTIVLFSDGFSLSGVEGLLRSTVERTIRAGVRIYAIDTRGLAGFPEHTINSLAVDTGGSVFFNLNRLDGALREIRDDTETYYVIGFEPQSTKYDGRFRKIEVRVKKKGVTVRARKGYFAVDPKSLQYGLFR